MRTYCKAIIWLINNLLISYTCIKALKNRQTKEKNTLDKAAYAMSAIF